MHTTVYIEYASVTENGTYLIEQSRDYKNLKRPMAHLKHTGFTFDKDLKCFINPETLTAAAIKTSASRREEGRATYPKRVLVVNL